MQFKEIDLDGNNRITPQEFTSYVMDRMSLDSHDYTKMEALIRMAFEAADIYRTGWISLTDFPHLSDFINDFLIAYEWFKIDMDINGDGHVTLKE